MSESHDEGQTTQHAVFIERIAARLREPEHVHPSFEKRLMQKVMAEGPALYPVASRGESWWRKEQVVRVSPLAGLALAAGIAGIVSLTGIAIASRLTPDRPVVAAVAAPARTDTVQMVRFIFVDSRASKVELVGDFNEWTRGATHLKRSGAPGVWSVSVPLSPGRHEYAFIINGSHWVADPLGVKSSDDFGTESSVIRVAPSGKSST
jgi:hypothetical protein